MARVQIDWEAIEKDWRAGVKTKKMMSEEYGISRAAMDKHFAKIGVERDLNAQIQARAEAKLNRQTLAEERKVTQVAQGDEKVTPDAVTQQRLDETEEGIIEANSTMIARNATIHKDYAGKAVTLSSLLVDEVTQQTVFIEDLQKLGELMYSPDEKGIDKMNEIYRKVISTSGRVDSAKKAIESLKTSVELHRKVLRIKDDTNTEDIVKVAAAAGVSAADAYKKMIGI